MEQERHQPTSHYYVSQRLRLHYVRWGDGHRPPLFLIHGSLDHCRSWDLVAQALMDRYTIYAPDLRGHGDSDWAIGGAYSFPEFVLDIAALADTVDRDPIVIIGHSLGGGIALQYAGIFPQRVAKVVSIEGWGPPVIDNPPAHVRMRQWIEQMRELERRQPRRYPTLEDAVRRMKEANPHLTDEMARHLTIHGVRRNEDGTYSWKFDNYMRQRSPYGFNLADAQDIWAQITAPVLLVKGAESWAPDPAKDGRTKVIRNARSVIIEGAGHWVHHDQLERFLQVVNEFLES
jgi:pimeloyl-ACP methyl ester carboxylesterase